MRELKVHVLIRFNKKSGKVDTVMTSLGKAQMKMWALNHTTSSKETVVIEQETGEVIFLAIGTKEGFPMITVNAGNCEDFGIPYELVASIKDDRF